MIAVGFVVAALAVDVAPAQNAAEKDKATKTKTAKNGAVPTKKSPPNAGDPLVGAQGKTPIAPGTYHYTFKLISYDRTPLAATYYPSRLTTTAPCLLLIHEKDRSSKDFEEPIGELKGQGLAEYLQGQGYAVLTFDLRGHGANLRRPLTAKDWKSMVGDLQAAYMFLVDRCNRGELNLSKLGVIGVGEGANLAAVWAATPGGAVSMEGRISDLGAMVLVTPLPDGEGVSLREVMAQVAARVPVLLMVGERDVVSADPVLAVKASIERIRNNSVETFPTSLHGFKLLRLEPKTTGVVSRFLELRIKFGRGADLKATEWEPRYNLTPVGFEDIQVVRNLKQPEPSRAQEKSKDKEKDAAPAKK